MLAAQEIFHMLPAACLMWPVFVVMPDLKLLSAFHCQMPPNVWVVMVALLQVAALQRGLRFNVGSCDYSGRVWKGSTSFISALNGSLTRWTHRLQMLLTLTNSNILHKSPNPHQAKPFFQSVPKVLLLNYLKRQFHLSFILAELINVFVFYNTMSTGLFHLITILHSLILLLPFFCCSATLARLHAATRYIHLSESPPCFWSLCFSDPRPHYTFRSHKASESASFYPCEVSRCRLEWLDVVWRHLSGISGSNTVKCINSASLTWLKTETMSLWTCQICFLLSLYLLQR